MIRHLVLLLALVACGAAGPAGIPAGDGSQTATVAGTELQVFTYRPACAPRLVLLVFHGVERNAAGYRDHAKPLADQACAIVVAPLFDRQRFPRNLYQYGGIGVQPPGRRTVDLVPPLVAWAQAAAGGPALPAVLLGHSAGAQFLDRVAAFVPMAARIVLANPSTWVLPGMEAAPFGFGGAGDAAAVRAYVERPLSVLLGTADTGMKDLATSPQAMAQGPNRHERGLNAVHAAQAAAQANGWRLGWTLAEVPGVGHNATRMFGSAQALAAVQRAAAP